MLLQFATMDAGEAVLKRLKAANLRPVDLATAIGVSRPMASLMLRGKRGISVWHLDAIAKLLGTQVHQLFMTRAESAHGKNVIPMTRVVTPIDQDYEPTETRGGSSHAQTGGGTENRLPESEASIDAEVQRGITRERNAIERELIESLYDSANHVRAVADALLGRQEPPTPGTGGTLNPSGDPPVRPSADRREKRA